MTLESMGTKKLRVKSKCVREFLAEFLGIFILMVFGLGGNAQSLLSRESGGTFVSVNWGWGLGVAMGVWVSGGISGGHINPAVSLAMVIVGRLKLRKLPVYWVAQYLGAFVASACVYGVYYDALKEFDGGIRSVTGKNATAGIWGTYPQGYLSTSGGFADQFLGTLLLLVIILAITDSKNMSPPKGMVPFCIGLAVFLIGVSFGWNCGFAVNPARDLSPRIFTAVAGWGVEVFSTRNYWFWVPLVAPHVGGICGAIVYLILIGFHEEEDSSEDKYLDDIDKQPVVLRDIRGVQNSAFSDTKANDSAHF